MFFNMAKLDLFGFPEKFKSSDEADIAPWVTSYDNPGGMGNRTASITVTTDAAIGGGGTISDWINGASDAAKYLMSDSIVGKYIRFDFGTTRIITEMRLLTDTTSIQGTWKFQGSNDAVAWTDIGATFSLGGATTTTYTELAANVTAYRYYQLFGMTGNGTYDTYFYEFEFKIF